MDAVYAEVRQGIAEIISELCKYEIDYAKGFNENGINSVMLVKIFVQAEKKFHIDFNEHDFDDDRFSTIDDFIQYVSLKQQEGK